MTPIPLMSRRTLLSLLAASPLPACATIAQGAGSDYVIRANANLVVLDVSVETLTGRPVTGLESKHFYVYEDGRRQVIRHFSSAEAPAGIAFALDESNSMYRRVAALKAAVHAFLDASNTLDEYLVIGFGDRPIFHLPAFSMNAKHIKERVDSIRPSGMTSLYDGLLAATGRLLTSQYERRALLLVSDGRDTASHATFRDALSFVRSNPMTVFTIGLFEDGDPDQNRGVLKTLARVSGGQYFHPRTPAEIARDCLLIARDIRSRYTLSYVPVDGAGQSGAVRKLKIAVHPQPHLPASERLVVRARTEIILAPPAAATTTSGHTRRAGKS